MGKINRFIWHTLARPHNFFLPVYTIVRSPHIGIVVNSFASPKIECGSVKVT